MNRVYNQEVNMSKRRKSSSKVVLVFILLLLVALAVTNPNKEDFTEYLVNGSFDNAESVGFSFKNLVNSVGSSFLNSVTERDNYIFLSVYYYGDGNDGPKYIGFLKRFFIEI